MTRREARRQQGEGAVYSEAEAVALLPCRDATARAWLREQGLVRTTRLGRIVIWADVVEALRQGEQPADPEPRPATSYPRAVLRGQRIREADS